MSVALKKNITAECAAPAPSKPMHWSVDAACWRNYAESMIYAAVTDTTGNTYLYEVELRRRNLTDAQRSTARRFGREMGDEIRAMFPQVAGIIPLARAACGEDERTQVAQRQRFTATCARCSRWLPKHPHAPRPDPQRTGQTDAERGAAADRNVDSWVGSGS